MYLGVEIGGTKLQVGLGPDDGTLRGLWRETVDVTRGPDGIRAQIGRAVPELLAQTGIDGTALRGIGIGFGGPVDDATRTVIKSHQIEGWDGFALADWFRDLVGLPAALGNDADVAGLAEALHGAGKGLSPIFYITIGSGIGGGFILNGEIYRGVGRGAAEIGHLRVGPPGYIVEMLASGWAIGEWARRGIMQNGRDSLVLKLVDGKVESITAAQVAAAAQQGDRFALDVLETAWGWLAEGICHVIALLCPRRIVIGGGVALMGERLLFEPLRRLVAQHVFRPFAGLTDIVPAALGEEVVVHGALALARRQLS